MSNDPVVRLAELKLIKDSADLEAEIASKAPGWFIHIYRRLRADAAQAMAALAFVDTEYDVKAYRDFQMRVRVFDSFILALREFISDGMNADEHMTEGERQETLDILLQQGEDGRSAAEALGLIEEPPGAGGA